MDRRKFIIVFTRRLLFAGIAFMSGYMILKNRTADKSTCDLNLGCNSCKRLKNCKLPEAENFKHQQKNIKVQQNG